MRLTETGYQNLYANSKSLAQIEDLILGEFEKQNSRANDVLMLRNLNFGLLKNLNPVETDLFEPAVNSLINKGLINYEKDGIECLRLTDKGYNSLYN